MANWKNEGKYWPGKITRISQGKYYIEYDDSGVEWCTVDQLKHKTGGDLSPKTTNYTSINWKKGDRVLGNWEGRGKYYPGKIAGIMDDQYFIQYDDGDTEWTTAKYLKRE